jgi:DegV family protein with EDD domain
LNYELRRFSNLRRAALPTAIVTDSTSDIPQDLLEEYAIFQIPADLILENKTYLDGFDISRNDFYEKLPTLKHLPTTASPSSGRFQNLYQEVFEEGYSEIISIHAASNLSGIFNSARLAALDFQEPIEVIDSQQLSLGLGFQVLRAAKDAIKGNPTNSILNNIQSIQSRISLFALLDTFEYIHRSGRVSWAKAQIGSLLNIKPVVELNAGKVINRGTARTRKKGIQTLGEILKGLGPLEELAVLHTNAESDGKNFIKGFSPNNIHQPLLVNVTTIIGTHVGPNGIGFAAVVK